MLAPCRIVLAILFLIVAAAAVADPYPVDSRIDVIHYRYALTLSDSTDAISVNASIDIRILDPDTDSVWLDLIKRSAMREERGMTVHNVASGGRQLRFAHEDDRLLIDVPDDVAATGHLALEIQYSGIPETGLIIGDNRYGDRTFFSDNWPNKARHWLATLDHIADKATSEFLVTAPSRLQIVSNGLLIERTNLGSDTILTHWKQSVPISPWLFALGAAEFAMHHVDEFDHKAIQTWVFHQDRDAGFYDFAVPTKAALEFYSSYVGPFEYEKLANIQSNSVGGGMEAASAIFYGDESVNGERTRRWQTTIVHEIAHQWFGNSVTEESWDDVWLSEGFATYFAYLFFEHAKGRNELTRYLMESRTRVFEFARENPGYHIVHDDLQDMSKVTTRQTYDKGAWVLHMLRARIGDVHWWSGIRNYYRKYRNSTATTRDFQREMEHACDCDLDTYFEQWLYQGGNIVLQGDWQYDHDAEELRISISRVDEDTLEFDTLIQIGVYSAGSPVPKVVPLRLVDGFGSLVVDVPEKPERVTIDPNTVLLAQWEFVERDN